MSDRYEKKLEDNAVLGADLVNKYLRGEIKGSDQVKIGSQAISQLNRHRATKGNMDMVKFAVGKSISADRKELTEYIRVNMPEYNAVKQLR